MVWATGPAYLSDGIYYSEYGYVQITSTTLTSTDQATLTQFLNGGGKFIITGMNALYFIEGSPFVRSTLNLDVASLVGGGTFSGASGTAFAGESHTSGPAPNRLRPLPRRGGGAPASVAVLQGSTEIPPNGSRGTAPRWPPLTPRCGSAGRVGGSCAVTTLWALNHIMNGKLLLAAAGKTVSGDMVDALKALNPPADSTPPSASSALRRVGGQRRGYHHHQAGWLLRQWRPPR